MKRLIIFLFSFASINLSFAQKSLIASDEGSKVHFVIKNFGIKTGGDFAGVKGTIRFDLANVAAWHFDVTVNAATIDTDNDSRDGHLKKEEYFDVAKYPVIQMVSSKVTVTDKPGIYLFTGSLTIKGISKQVQFPFKVNRLNDGYLFTGEFGINRRDFGVGGNSVSLADNLKVSLNIYAK